MRSRGVGAGSNPAGPRNEVKKMNGGKPGAVCDVSVLADRASFEQAQRLFDGGAFYLPSATYSWLARDKLISVRGKMLGYSLVSQFVRSGELLVIYLPELCDELARRLLFACERGVPLTDLRAAMLAAHMKLPLLALDGELVERFQENFDAQTLWQLDAHADWLAVREALGLYRELASDFGSYLYQHLNDEGAFRSLVDELRKCRGDNLRAVTAAVRRLSQARANPGVLSLEYLALDLAPVVGEYLEQHVLSPEIVRELCERMLLLVARPLEKTTGGDSNDRRYRGED